jgi:hypothetical protein
MLKKNKSANDHPDENVFPPLPIWLLTPIGHSNPRKTMSGELNIESIAYYYILQTKEVIVLS